MKKIIFAAVLAIAASAPSGAVTQAAEPILRATVTADVERVDSIPALGRMHSWRAIDKDTLIIWTTAFRPYLIELAHPSPDLRFSEAIGVTESAGRVHSRFDSVLIRGFRYPIEEIYRLSPEYAKSL